MLPALLHPASYLLKIQINLPPQAVLKYRRKWPFFYFLVLIYTFLLYYATVASQFVIWFGVAVRNVIVASAGF